MTWEERWHPLREEWVIIAAHRQDRPWNGETLTNHRAEVAAYVADCYLCPGNLRVSGKRNDNYSGTFVFDNDHPCVGEGAPAVLEQPPAPYKNQSARVIARVVCTAHTTICHSPNSKLPRLKTCFTFGRTSIWI